MAEVQIERVSIRHEAIMYYMMCNPVMKLGDVARHFGITQAWLSVVIHSDAFQMMLRDKQDIAFNHTVLPLREKMTSVAHLALDRLAETLPMEPDVAVVNKVAENVLERLGFGTKGPAVQINNQTNTQVNVLHSELEEARALLLQPKSQRGVMFDGVRATIALPPEDTSRVGSVNSEAAVQFSPASLFAGEAGSEV